MMIRSSSRNGFGRHWTSRWPSPRGAWTVGPHLLNGRLDGQGRRSGLHGTDLAPHVLPRHFGLTATSAQWKRSPLSVNWTGGEHYGVREDRFWRPANFRMARNRSQRQTPRSRLELNLARQMLRVAAPVANYERCGGGFCPVRNRAKRHECRHGRLELALRFAIVELWM